jgi:hypothetical protein
MDGDLEVFDYFILWVLWIFDNASEYAKVVVKAHVCVGRCTCAGGVENPAGDVKVLPTAGYSSKKSEVGQKLEKSNPKTSAHYEMRFGFVTRPLLRSPTWARTVLFSGER